MGLQSFQTLKFKKMKDAPIEMRGKVIEVLLHDSFNVELENNTIVLVHLSGKLRKYRIRILLGDKVLVEMSPFDLTRGRIIYRFRD